jgi:hypothetical protein
LGLGVFASEQRRGLLEIVEEWCQQVPVDRWHDIIGDPTIADVILDRIVHNAHLPRAQGDSLPRKLAAPQPAA